MGVSNEDKIRAVHGYVEAFEEGSAEAAAALFADDATVEDPVGTPIKNGQAEILPFYETAMASGAKLELTGEPRCAGDSVAFPFTVNLELDGKKTVLEVIDVFRLNDDGKIVEMRAYWGPENMKSA